jgi:O-acetyl-ADP-ribose deacetylase (regulator of RNase III)
MTHLFISGNIFNSTASALVDAVNCVGVKGAGLAKQFRESKPLSYQAYRQHCLAGDMSVGKVFLTVTEEGFIFHFPTKDHWKDPSDISWVRSGLLDLVAQINQLGIESIAIPQLGCGLGGLNWSDVAPLIVAASQQCPRCHFEIYGAYPDRSIFKPVVRRK